MHCLLENKRIYKGMQFDRLKIIAVSDSSQALVNMIYTNFVKNSFEFKSANETFVSKVIDKFNAKKATGVDKISLKLMKFGKISLLSPITKIINMSIDSGIFPH